MPRTNNLEPELTIQRNKNMNFFQNTARTVTRIVKTVVLVGAACLASRDAHGQGRGLDLYRATRIYDLGHTNSASASALSLTNLANDIHGMDGISTIYLQCGTNQSPGAGTNGVTCSIYLSPDQTNWNILTNYSLITSNTTFLVTNGMYGGTNLFCTNRLEYPFTWTVPTASTAGSSTPFASPVGFGFTNGGAITVSNQGWTVVGFDAGVLASQGASAGTLPPRYLQLVWTVPASNFSTMSGILTTSSRQNYP